MSPWIDGDDLTPANLNTKSTGIGVNAADAAYGVIADNATDNGVALNLAIAAARTLDLPLLLPAGIIRTTLQHSFLDLSSVIGVPEETIIRPTAAVTSPCVRISSTDQLGTGFPRSVYMSGVIIDGSLTTGKVGLKIGHASDVAVSGRIIIDRVEVKYFQGTGGVALQVADVVHPVFINSRFTRSDINILIDADDTALPTLPSFSECYVNYATTKGLKIVHAWLPKFDHCVFEANGEEGALLDPGAAETVLKAVFEDCWFEANYLGHVSRTSNYAFVADGTAATCQPHLLRCYFSGTAATERGARFIACTDIQIESPFLNNATNRLVFDANCQGHIRGWDENAGALLTLVSNASTLLKGWTNSGQGIVLNGTTSIDVAHGLGVIPPMIKIRLQTQNNLGNASHYWLSNIDATTFRINVDTDPGATTAIFGWEIVL